MDDLLGSVRAFGRCPNAHLVVFALDDSSALDQVASRHGATVVHCRPRRSLNPTSKAVLYAVARVIPAERFLCLDADMLVLGDLGPLFSAIDACLSSAVLICRDNEQVRHLSAALDDVYGRGADPPFFARRSAVGVYPLVVNDGLLAASGPAMRAFEAELRALPDVVRWVDERADIPWRNQFAANVALAKAGTAVELDPTWNMQLNTHSVDVDGRHVRWRGREVRVLHFNGADSKRRHGALRDTIRAELRVAPSADTGRTRRYHHGPQHQNHGGVGAAGQPAGAAPDLEIAR
ncbi:MAG: hypothetical protein ACQSGP_23710 [Frankia sp.]